MLFSGEIIRSRQNKNIVELCKLTDRKAREATRTFRFDGIKLLEEAIKNDVEICAVFCPFRHRSACLIFCTHASARAMRIE